MIKGDAKRDAMSMASLFDTHTPRCYTRLALI